MEPLITIETIPIEIKYVEKEPLKLSSVGTTQVSISQEDGKQSIRSNPIRIPVQDSFETSSTYNWEHSTYTATANVGEDGNLKLNIKMEDGEARAIRFEQTNRDINSMVALLPASAQDEDYTSSVEMSFNVSDLQNQVSGGNNIDTQFYPPDLELVVTQRPDVVITYVGGPIYVPPSSDPDYKPVEGAGPMYFPESYDPTNTSVGEIGGVSNSQKLDQIV